MRRLLSPIALSVAVLAVAGCGGSSPFTAPAKTTATKTAAAATRTTTVTATSTDAKAGCAPARQPQPATGRTHETPPSGQLTPGRRWTVILDTNCGLISIDLAVSDSPKTAASFAGLVQRGFFNGLTFHRVANGPDGQPFVIQGGDPLGSGVGGPGYRVVEPPPTNVDYTRGVVAMAKESAEPAGASGSQFFIVTAPDAQLPAQYALLGHVVAGMGAVDRIAAVPTQGNEIPVSPVVIRTATVTAH